MRSPQIIPDPLLRPAYRIYEARLAQKMQGSPRPQHVAVILDGHRRFARQVGLTDFAMSYRTGMSKFLEFIEWAAELDIPAITGWVLSTDNLTRPTAELDPYFDVLIELMDELPTTASKHGYGVRFIGSLDVLPERLRSTAKQTEESCRAGDRRLTIAMGYGGRQEIVDACRDLVRDLAHEGLTGDELAERITADLIASHLYLKDVPDPDLVIRTSGESRLSGFLLWQAAYSEYSFVDVYWPEFRKVDFLRALRDFGRRERRFGK